MKSYDKHFIERCKKQDRLTQKQLFEEMYVPLFRTAQRYLPDYTEAEDCVMKGFLKALMNIDKFTFSNEYGLAGWMKQIVINEALMVLRSRRVFTLSIEDKQPDLQIENDAIQKIAAEELQQLLMQLPDGYRTVFCLYVIDGYEHAEIARLLKISEGTSRSQLSKAKNKLKHLLERGEHEQSQLGRI